MTITDRQIYIATTRMGGSKMKHFAAALGTSLDDAAAHWPAAKEILAKREARRSLKLWLDDPLIIRMRTRPHRTPSRVAASNAAAASRQAAIEASIAAEVERANRREAARRSLIAAAREARRLGYQVRASKGRDGRISSYYCRPVEASGPALRISDHDIPQNDRRDFMAAAHGRSYFDGYHGPQIIVDRPRRAEWLRRAICLAANGRCIPCAEI
jgi:hypothetical protein